MRGGRATDAEFRAAQKIVLIQAGFLKASFFDRFGLVQLVNASTCNFNGNLNHVK